MKKLVPPSGIDEESDLNFGNELRETSRLLLRALKESFSLHGITVTQFLLLRQLGSSERINQSEITERLGTTPPATVATVDFLEKRDLIKRVRGTDDRRMVHIVLTPKGQTMQKKLLQYAFDISTTALYGMPARDVKQMRASLAQVRENLETRFFGARTPPGVDEDV